MQFYLEANLKEKKDWTNTASNMKFYWFKKYTYPGNVLVTSILNSFVCTKLHEIVLEIAEISIRNVLSSS